MITLAMAQPVEHVILQKLKTLQQELHQVSEVTYMKGNEPIKPERTVQNVLSDMDNVQYDLLKLRSLRDRVNASTVVPWQDCKDSTPLFIDEAITKAKQLRERITLYTGLASEDPNPRTIYMSTETVRAITYNPTYFKLEAEKLTKQVNALSIAIDVANAGAKVNFDASEYLEGLV